MNPHSDEGGGWFVDGVDLSTLPKISLHDHLDGGLRPETIIELSDMVGHELPTTNATLLQSWFSERADSHDLEDYLETFEHTLAVMQTEACLVRVAREFVQDLAEDGVVYGELRWAPEQHLERGLTLDTAVDAVQEGIELGVADARASGRELDVRQLLCAMRQNSNSLEVAKLAVRHRRTGVVGFDIAGPEVGYPPSLHAEAFDYVASKFLPTTVHAGEEGDLASIASAILDGRALRLGHGIHIAEDLTVEDADDVESIALGPLAAWVRDRGIVLECCPSSNLQTAALDAYGDGLEDHPFDLLYEAGFRVTVNPDNRLMSHTSVTREMARLADTFGYDLSDLAVFTLNAAEGAFLPVDEREDLADRISEAFDELGA